MPAIPATNHRSQPCTIPVAIYTRVSTLGQVGGRFDSCESQAAICRDFIAKHAGDGWFEAASYSDPAYSGGTMKRPGMEALMRHIAQGGIRVVVIFKLERVLRSTAEWAPFRAFLRQHRCRLESPMENLTEETAMDRFHNNLRVNLAEFERENTGDKVRAKMVAQVQQGIWNCGQVPFGYDYDVKTKALSPHPSEAPIVRRIYEETARLVTLTTLANTLNDEGLRTRTRLFQRRDGRRETVGGKRFRSDKLRQIIRSPIYLGRVHLHGEDYPGHHEPLVSQSLWDKANAAVAKPLPARCTLQARDKYFHLLKGVIFCGHCARAMTPNASGRIDSNGRPYRYYTCGHVHKDGNDADCPIRHVGAGLVESVVVNFLGAVAQHPEVIRRAIAVTRARAKEDQASLRQRAADMEKSLSALNRKIANCVEALAAGGVELLGDELRQKIAALKDEKHALLVAHEQVQQQLSGFDQEELDTGRVTRALGHFADVMAKLPQSEQRDLVRLCVQRIDLTTGRSNRGAEGGRPFELRLKLHAARLVEGMEERIVVEKNGRASRQIGKPVVTIDATLSMTTSRATIQSPFQHEVGAPLREPVRPEERPDVRHPLRLAMTWEKRLASGKVASHAAFARQIGISGPTLTRHLQLLRLAPEIRDAWLAMTSAAQLRHFSLNRMVKLSGLELGRQRERWPQMHAGRHTFLACKGSPPPG